MRSRHLNHLISEILGQLRQTYQQIFENFQVRLTTVELQMLGNQACHVSAQLENVFSVKCLSLDENDGI